MQIPARDYSAAEDIANTWSAAVGLVVFLAFSPLLYRTATGTGDPALVYSALIFSFCVVFLYLSSTLYHALPRGKARTSVRLCDHSAIFLLIAGTYTPFAAGPLRQHGGISLLIVEWTLAIIGIGFKIAGNLRFQHIANFIYIGMGWLGIFWVREFFQEVAWPGCALIIGGGILYTAGIAFYAAKHRPYAHLIWHLFVFAGTCCHAYAIWRYAF